MDGNEICLLEHRQVLRYALPGHVHASAEFHERLTALLAKSVKEPAAIGIAQRLEDQVHAHARILGKSLLACQEVQVMLGRRFPARATAVASRRPGGRVWCVIE